MSFLIGYLLGFVVGMVFALSVYDILTTEREAFDVDNDLWRL